MNPAFKIAVIAGDGIGKEVMPEGLRVLNAAAAQFGIDLDYTHIEWANCDYYASHGQMMLDFLCGGSGPGHAARMILLRLRLQARLGAGVSPGCYH